MSDPVARRRSQTVQIKRHVPRESNKNNLNTRTGGKMPKVYVEMTQSLENTQNMTGEEQLSVEGRNTAEEFVAKGKHPINDTQGSDVMTKRAPSLNRIDQYKRRRSTVSGLLANEDAKGINNGHFRTIDHSIEVEQKLENESVKEKSESEVYNSSDGFKIMRNDTQTLASKSLATTVTNMLEPGEFLVQTRVIRKAKTSLCCKFSNENRARQRAVQLISHRWFDNFITVGIALNSLVMVLYSYKDHARCEHMYGECQLAKQETYNYVLDSLNIAFGLVFTTECLIKLLAMGCFDGYKTYFRSGWNAIDFIIVFSFILELTHIIHLNVRILRVLRILRPLKAAQSIPSLKKQVNVLIKSIKGIFNVVLFLIFFFLLFSIAGVHSFSNSANYTCRVGPPPVYDHDDKCKPWTKYSDFTGDVNYKKVCTPDKNQLFSFVSYQLCPQDFNHDSRCGSILNEGFPTKCLIEVEDTDQNSVIAYGINGFDNIGEALTAIFQIITLDSWSPIMYNLANWTAHPIFPTLFCITLVFFISFYLLQLMLAVVMESYLDYEKQQLAQQKEKFQAKKASIQERLLAMSAGKVSKEILLFRKVAVIQQQQQLINSDSEHQSVVEPASAGYANVSVESGPKEMSSHRLSSNESPGLRKKSFGMRNKFKQTFEKALARKVEEKTAMEQELIKEQIAVERELIEIQEDQHKNECRTNPLDKKQKDVRLRNSLDKLSAEPLMATIQSSKVSKNEKDLYSSLSSLIEIAIEKKITLIQEEEKTETQKQDKNEPQPEKEKVRAGTMTMSLLKKRISDQGIKNEGNENQSADPPYKPPAMLMRILKKSEEMIEQADIESRAKKNCLYKFTYNLVKHSAFKFFIATCILVNTVILAFEGYPKSNTQDLVSEYSNMLFYFIFLIEMCLKLAGYGYKHYFRRTANTFDMVIVVISTFDVVFFFMRIVFEQDQLFLENLASMILVFRIFRVIRIFKLARTWPRLEFFLTTMVNTISNVGSFGILLSIFIFMYAILGMEVLSYKVRLNRFDKPVPYFITNNTDVSEKFSVPDSNFDTFMNAVTSVFIVLANDGWTTIYFNYYRTVGPVTSSLFFVSLVVIGQMILLNLFLSMMLEKFDDEKFDRESQDSSLHKTCKNLLECTRKSKKNSQKDMKEEKDETEQNNYRQIQNVHDSALFIFSSENAFRISIQSIVNSTQFANFIMGMIVVQTAILALENPLNDPESNLVYFLKGFDYFTTAIFLVEIILLVVAKGLLFNGPQSYLRNVPQIVDFIIVVGSMISLLEFSELSIFKILRVVRLLRSIRLISRNESLRLSMQALVAIIPSIASLMVVSGLIMFIFGIVGANLFSGKSFYCDLKPMAGMISKKEIEELIDTKEACLNYGGLWSKYQTHFDDVFASTAQFTIMSQLVYWPNIMYQMVNSRGPDMVPGYKEGWNNQLLCPLFMLFVMIGGFFVMNLFVLVVISAFNKETTRLGWDFLLTQKQKKWMNTKILVRQVKPKIAFVRPVDNYCRAEIYDIVTNTKFEITIMVAIILNTCLMTVTWASIKKEDHQTLERINHVFSGLFMIEIILKLFAYQCRFFKDKWNIFDFFIVIFPFLIGIVANIMNFGHLNSTVAQTLRILRIGRLLKLVRGAKRMQIILQTFVNTVSSLMNIAILMFLIIYIYSIFAVHFFATTKWNLPLHERLNFSDIWTSFITLIRASTGEWHDVMFAYALEKSESNDCIDNPTFEDYEENGNMPVGCGNPLLIYAFFATYLVQINCVFLNLFIAIILNGYFLTINSNNQYLDPQKTEFFIDAWSRFDPDATGSISAFDFKKMMYYMGSPLGWEIGPDQEIEETRYLGMAVKLLNEQDGRLQFNDVLDTVVTIRVITEDAKTAFEKRKKDKEQKPDQKKKEHNHNAGSECLSQYFSANSSDGSNQMSENSQNPGQKLSMMFEESSFIQKSFTKNLNVILRAKKKVGDKILTDKKQDKTNKTERENSVKLGNFVTQKTLTKGKRATLMMQMSSSGGFKAKDAQNPSSIVPICREGVEEIYEERNEIMVLSSSSSSRYSSPRNFSAKYSEESWNNRVPRINIIPLSK